MDFDFAVFECEDLRFHTVTSLSCSTHSTSASPRPVWGQPVNTMDLLNDLQWLIPPPHIGINLHIGSRYSEWWKERVFTYFEVFFFSLSDLEKNGMLPSWGGESETESTQSMLFQWTRPSKITGYEPCERHQRLSLRAAVRCTLRYPNKSKHKRFCLPYSTFTMDLNTQRFCLPHLNTQMVKVLMVSRCNINLVRRKDRHRSWLRSEKDMPLLCHRSLLHVVTSTSVMDLKMNVGGCKQ
jgi:hypothetical protein